MAVRTGALLLVLLTFSATSSVDAQETERPAFAIETRTNEGSVAIDAKLRSDPALHAMLLAEGKRELAKWRRERSAVGPYLCITRLDYIDGLGAHPNHGTNTILWDTRAKKAVSIRPLFKESGSDGPKLKRLAHEIRMKFAEEKKSRDIAIENPDTDPMLSQVNADLLHMGAAALAPSIEPNKSAGLIFYFSPYAVGSYVEGGYSAFVPWTYFKDDLSAEGAGLFGGELPEGDEKND